MNVIPISKRQPKQLLRIACRLCLNVHTFMATGMESAYKCPHCKQWTNEYGVAAYVNTCAACNREYSLSPKPNADDDWEGWTYCLAPGCSSYDPEKHKEAEIPYD